MVTGIMLANLEIWERSQREPRLKGMGTTCVAVYFLDDSLIIGHVGDSRCYRARGTEMSRWISQSVSEPKATIAAATGAGER